MAKQTLVLDGGAQMGAYQWGVMTELYKQGIGPDYFNHYVCTSSGAFNAAFFLSEQFDEGKSIWLKYLPEMFWKPLSNDMAALGNILRTIQPLNCEAIKNRKERITLALTNTRTKQTDYSTLNDEPDMVNALLAGCAMPILARPHELRGNMYYDGALLGQPQLDKAKSLDKDAEVWVIMVRPHGYRLAPLEWKIFSGLAVANPTARQLLANSPKIRNDIYERIEADSSLRVIRPAKPLPIGYRSKNKKLIEQTYDLGRMDAKEFLTNLT